MGWSDRLDNPDQFDDYVELLRDAVDQRRKEQREEAAKNHDPAKCDCGKGDWCPLWESGQPDPDARVQRDRRVAVELRNG